MNKKGFTIIEILIVLAIIGIMFAIVTTYLTAAKQRGRDAVRIANVKELQQAIEIYFSNCYQFPATLEALMNDCGGSSNSRPILNSIPKDPLGRDYGYYTTSNRSNMPMAYHVCAELELSTTGTGKSGQPPIVTGGREGDNDPCDGTIPKVYDKYGP
jgi:type II secretion system protein G